jgi:cytochrome c biogenesis protein CcmG, thiol:disulfide interchange protein DsbE
VSRIEQLRKYALRALPLVAMAGLMSWNSFGQGPSAGVAVGSQMPPLSAPLADGSRFDLTHVDGIVVLNFWASYCGPCRAEAPMFSDLQAQGTDVHVVGLSVEPFPLSEVARRAGGIGMRYPVGVADEALLSRLRVQSVPTTYVIGKTGKVVLSRVGAISKNELDAALEAARDAT